jgi:hypothetical protein
MAIPARRNKAYLWSFALPFALQNPLLKEDLYDRFLIVEPYDVYCCPSQQWWTRLRPVLASLTNERIVYVVTEDAGTRALFAAPIVLGGTALKERIEKALLRPLDAPGFEISRSNTGRVSRILFPELEEEQ